MSAEREAGLAALQNGNAAEAIPYLERAAGNAPNDLQTLLPLGAAYGQVGRHADAVRTVMQAVTQEPSNAQARCHLAVAYANAGHTEYALTAAQQALQLQPGYPQALALAARLSGTPSPTPATLMGAQPTTQMTSPGYGEPTQSFAGQPAAPTPYGQTAAPTLYGQTQTPSTQTPSPSRQPTTPYGAPASAPYPSQAGAGDYQGQGAAAYGGSPPAAYYTPPARPGILQPPEKFDLKQALADWVRVIREPNAFFREQAERTGYNAPLAFLLVFGVADAILIVLTSLLRLARDPSSAPGVAMIAFLGLISAVTNPFIGALVWGGVLHLVGKLFGNRQPYQKSFRVVAYARAPLVIFTLITSLVGPFIPSAPLFTSPSTNSPSPFGRVTPVQFTEPSAAPMVPGQVTSSPFDGTTPSRDGGSRTPTFLDPSFLKAARSNGNLWPITLIGIVWVWCLEAIGLKYAQNTSGGQAAGTVFIAVLIPTLLAIALVVLVSVALAGLIGATRGASGFQNLLSLLHAGSAVWLGL